METLPRAVRNVLSQLGSQAVTWIATLFFTAALGRYLGDAGFGSLYLALALTGIFGVLVDFGLQPLVTREVARRPDLAAQYLLYAAVVKCAVWLASLAAIVVLGRALGYPPETRTVLLICSLTMGAQAISFLLGAVFRGLERLGPVSLANVLEKTVNVAAGLVVLSAGARVVAVAWVLLAGALAGLLWQAALLLPTLRLGAVRWEPDFARRLLLAAAPFAVYWFLGNVYWRIDVVMLSTLSDHAAVGTYGAAYRLFDTLLFLPNIVAASVLLPVLSRLATESRVAAGRSLDRAMSLLLLAGIPIAAGTVVLAGQILAFVYGRPEFQAGVPAMRILGAGIVVLYINACAGWALLSLDLERRVLVVPALALALNIGLNLVLIPRWGGAGAASATVLCEVLVGAAYLRLLPPEVRPRRTPVVALRATAAAAGMVVALVLLHDAPLPLVVPAGAIVYGALALLFRAIPVEDVMLLHRALGFRAGRTAPPAVPSVATGHE